MPRDSNRHQHATQPAAAGRRQRASFQGGTGLGASGAEAVGTATAVTVLGLDELLEVLLGLLLHDGFTGPNICREDKEPADAVFVLGGYPFIGQRNKYLKAKRKSTSSSFRPDDSIICQMNRNVPSGGRAPVPVPLPPPPAETYADSAGGAPVSVP